MDKRVNYKSPKFNEAREHRRSIFKKKIVTIFSILIFIFVCLVFLSYWKEINIKHIRVNGNKVILKEDIEKIILQNINAKYFYIIPKSNGLLYPRNKISKEILETYKRIDSLKIDTQDFQTLDVVLTENKAEYTWCGDQVQTLDKDTNIKEKEECYFMNKDGYIFDIAPDFSGNVYLKFYGAMKKENNSPVGFYFSPKYFKDITIFYQSLKNINFDPTAFYVKNNTDVEVLLNQNVSSTIIPKILYRVIDNPKIVIQNLISSISTDPLKSRVENEYESLLYLDLRYDNKVYYKFK